jgi:hypothetical protein
MSGNAELHLKSDHVRAIDRLDVATDRTGGANVTMDPWDASISLGGSQPAATGEVTVGDTSGSAAGTLSASNEAGSLELNDSNSFTYVHLDAAAKNQTNEIEVLHGGDVMASVGNAPRGGRIAVHSELQTTPTVEVEGKKNGGRVHVRNLRGETAGELRGEDASLLLSDDQQSGLSAAGGGELVIGSMSSPTDVHVHATGKFQSAYGLGNGNRPRILLNGPEATIELGRAEQGNGASAKHGQVLLRDDNGERLLELRATQDSSSEVVFKWSDGGSPVRRGTIRAVEDGLMFRDANGDDALLISNNGQIRTAASAIDEGGLQP